MALAGTMLRVCRRSSETGKKKVCGAYGELRYVLYKKSKFFFMVFLDGEYGLLNYDFTFLTEGSFNVNLHNFC